jgi:hypothetical protein
MVLPLKIAARIYLTACRQLSHSRESDGKLGCMRPMWRYKDFWIPARPMLWDPQAG